MQEEQCLIILTPGKCIGLLFLLPKEKPQNTRTQRSDSPWCIFTLTVYLMLELGGYGGQCCKHLSSLPSQNSVPWETTSN